MAIKSSSVFKIIALVLCFSLIFEQSGFAQIAGELDLSSRFARLTSSFTQDKFRPLHLRYISYDNLKNNFKLLLDKGTSVIASSGDSSSVIARSEATKQSLDQDKLKSETKTLLNYFFIGISLSNESFWVNLRPDAEDNIIDQFLAQTDVGKILLEADLQLKKDTASFTSPQTPEGKEYWDKLYRKAGELYGNENITIPTLTRPWIVPGEIIIRETPDNAYIYKATLKVMLEQDYLKDSTSTLASTYSFKDERSRVLNEYSSQLIRELIIPKLTKDVNTAKRYAPLRQVYYSLILAQWFKQKFYGKSGMYSVLINKKNLTGLTSKDAWSKTTYFQAYKKSFAEGEYNINEKAYSLGAQTIRNYMSGGIAIGQEITKALLKDVIGASPLKNVPDVKDNIGLEAAGSSLVSTPFAVNISEQPAKQGMTRRGFLSFVKKAVVALGGTAIGLPVRDVQGGYFDLPGSKIIAQDNLRINGQEIKIYFIKPSPELSKKDNNKIEAINNGKEIIFDLEAIRNGYSGLAAFRQERDRLKKAVLEAGGSQEALDLIDVFARETKLDIEVYINELYRHEVMHSLTGEMASNAESAPLLAEIKGQLRSVAVAKELATYLGQIVTSLNPKFNLAYLRIGSFLDPELSPADPNYIDPGYIYTGRIIIQAMLEELRASSENQSLTIIDLFKARNEQIKELARRVFQDRLFKNPVPSLPLGIKVPAAVIKEMTSASSSIIEKERPSASSAVEGAGIQRKDIEQITEGYASRIRVIIDKYKGEQDTPEQWGELVRTYYNLLNELAPKLNPDGSKTIIYPFMGKDKLATLLGRVYPLTGEIEEGVGSLGKLLRNEDLQVIGKKIEENIADKEPLDALDIENYQKIRNREQGSYIFVMKGFVSSSDDSVQAAAELARKVIETVLRPGDMILVLNAADALTLSLQGLVENDEMIEQLGGPSPRLLRAKAGNQNLFIPDVILLLKKNADGSLDNIYGEVIDTTGFRAGSSPANKQQPSVSSAVEEKAQIISTIEKMVREMRNEFRNSPVLAYGKFEKELKKLNLMSIFGQVLVDRYGRGILIIGDSKAGKSRLTKELLDEDGKIKLVTDDHALVTVINGELYASINPIKMIKDLHYRSRLDSGDFIVRDYKVPERQLYEAVVKISLIFNITLEGIKTAQVKRSVSGPNMIAEAILARQSFIFDPHSQDLVSKRIRSINVVDVAVLDVILPRAHELRFEDLGKVIGDIKELTRVDMSSDSSSSTLRSSEDLRMSVGSSPSSDKGGVDFRALPITTQQAQVGISAASAIHFKPIPLAQLKNEWEQIETMLSAGIVPSVDRIRGYLQSCCVSSSAISQETDKVLSCLAEILRMEEDRVEPTNPELKAMLSLLESDKPANEMQLALVKIATQEKAPQVMNQ